MQIHPITLAFEKDQEKEYQKVYFKDSLPIVRVAIFLTGLLYGLFGYLDILVVGEHLKLFMLVRYVVVIPFMALVIIFSYYNFFFRIWQQMLFTAFLISGTGVSLMITQLPDNAYYYGGLMLVYSTGYFFIRLRFILASLAGWITLIIFNMIMLFLAHIDIYLLIPFNFFYISANLIGMFATYYIEVSDRRNFYLNQQLNDKKLELENVNKNLENIVEERTRDLIESEERFRNLADLLPLMVYEINTEGILTYVNQEAIKQLGVSKSEIYNHVSIMRFLAPEVRDKAMGNLKLSIQYPGISKAEYVALRKDGTKFPIIDYSSPIIRNERIMGMRSVVVDLSEQKANEQLRTEIAVARQSAEFKQNFLANMSHEIRTPLTGIIGITEILSNTQLDKNQNEYLGTLRQSTENLREIINQILDYSKIEAGKVLLKPSAFPTKLIFEQAIKYFNSIIQKPVELNVNIHDNLPPCIKADLQRINQIISNLISNAVKFTPQGTISLSAQVKKWIDERNLVIKIEIQDTGMGISEDQQKLLFKPFSQIDHKDTRNFEGTGLGLTICKDLAHILKGEIGLESQPNKGSTFWFTFEATLAGKSEISAEIIRQNEKTYNGSLRILLVEDKIINQKVIRLLLSSQGHQVTTADNGKQALEIYAPQSYDLILMDIQMPVMDGITATRQLRQKYGEQPIIVGLSANAFEGDKEKYMSQGMNDYLTKPVKSNDFHLLIEKLFAS